MDLETLNGNKSPAEMRDAIFALEKAIIEEGRNVAEAIVTKHHFAPGVYMREIEIPAGMVVTGAIHKTEHLNLLTKGRLAVWTEDGMKVLDAPQIIKSYPGIKRVGYAHTDSIWVTVHQNPDNEMDTEKLWDRLVTLDPKFVIDLERKPEIEEE